MNTVRDFSPGIAKAIASDIYLIELEEHQCFTGVNAKDSEAFI